MASGAALPRAAREILKYYRVGVASTGVGMERDGNLNMECCG